MNNDLAQDATHAALRGDWTLAISLNKQILKTDPSDIDALNRLARACAEVGETKKAISFSKKVLKLDPFDNIAVKCIKKWGSMGKSTEANLTTTQELFLEEPGITKMVDLLNPGDSKVLAGIDAGDEIVLATHSHRVGVTTMQGKHIGRLPDDLSARLKNLTRMGNKYQAFVKSVNPEQKLVKVFIREIEKGQKTAKIVSFSTDKLDYVAHTPPESIHDRREIDSVIQESQDRDE